MQEQFFISNFSGSKNGKAFALLDELYSQATPFPPSPSFANLKAGFMMSLCLSSIFVGQRGRASSCFLKSGLTNSSIFMAKLAQKKISAACSLNKVFRCSNSGCN
jgi:hypothetical protein